MLFTERDKQKVSGESFWQSPLTVYSHSVYLGGGGNKSSLIIRPSLKQNNTCVNRRPADALCGAALDAKYGNGSDEHCGYNNKVFKFFQMFT